MQVGDYHKQNGRWVRHNGIISGVPSDTFMPEDFEPGEGDRVYDPTVPLQSTHAPGTKPPYETPKIEPVQPDDPRVVAAKLEARDEPAYNHAIEDGQLAAETTSE